MGIARRPCCTDDDWLTVGPIAPHAGAIKQHFADGRYAPTTVASYLSGIAHFARWARGKRLRLRRIDEVSATEFLDQHLPHCRCEGSVRHDRCDHRAALGHLLFVLRAQGVIASPAKSTTPVDEELRRYDAYMDHVRGLAPKTRTQVLRVVGRLLRQRFGGGCVDIAAIKPAYVAPLLRAAGQAPPQARRRRLGGGRVARLLPLPRLARRSRSRLDRSGVSYPANWRLVLAAQGTHGGRSRAIGRPRSASPAVRCGAPTRSCAVPWISAFAAARSRGSSLDDIDWRAGTITLRHTKGLREDVLPLPAATGEAIAAYLKNERPQTSNRAVFVRHIAPRDEPVGPRSGPQDDSPGLRAAPGCPTRDRICCATRWPAGCWQAAPRSRRWPTCCVIDR